MTRPDPPRRPPTRRPRPRRHLPPWLWLLVGVVVLGLGAVLVTRGGGSDSEAAAASETPVAAALPDSAGEVRLGPRDRELLRQAATGTGVLKGGGTRRAVALTFDDGPGDLTPSFLSELRRLGVPATFFVVGQNVAERPDALRAIVAAGHEVAVHTWTHPDLRTLDARRAREEIARSQAVITETTGVEARLMRPPYGAIDAGVLDLMRRQKLITLMWDVDTEDWTGLAADAIARRAVDGARPGSVILMHDGGPRSETLAALPAIVRGLRAKGFTFETAGDLLVSDPPGPADLVSERESSGGGG